MFFLFVQRKRTQTDKTSVTIVTFEGPCSGVAVHVNISALFVGEHFWTDIAFELR